MIALFDNNQDLEACGDEAATQAGQLLTPLTRYRNRAAEKGFPWAMDNGAFSSFDSRAFLSLLERERPNRGSCLFVAAPDVVCNARRTLELFDHWYAKLSMWPVALVCQNGQGSLPIPWHLLSAVFIGGDDKWKLGRHARDIIKTAKAMGKWAHVGRVNSKDRRDYFESIGADSYDGTGVSRYTHMRRALAEKGLFDATTAAGMEAAGEGNLATALPETRGNGSG